MPLPVQMPHILFVFLDGIGLGAAQAAFNPFSTAHLPAFNRLGSGHPWTADLPEKLHSHHCVKALDANLGVAGLPQSGTGQASLFTGVNCAERAGKHFGPYPHSTSRPVLARANIFSQLLALNCSVAFANAYPPRFFAFMEKKNRWTVTTRCCLEAQIPIRGLEELHAGQALTADLTGVAWREQLQLDAPLLSAHDAGRQYHALARTHTFTLLEYFYTDKAGHQQDLQHATRILATLDEFFAGVLSQFDVTKDLLIVTSDHGNLEDLRVKTHTRHPVPFIAYGHGAKAFHALTSITDVTPALVNLLTAYSRPMSTNGAQ